MIENIRKNKIVYTHIHFFSDQSREHLIPDSVFRSEKVSVRSQKLTGFPFDIIVLCFHSAAALRGKRKWRKEAADNKVDICLICSAQ